MPLIGRTPAARFASARANLLILAVSAIVVAIAVWFLRPSARYAAVSHAGFTPPPRLETLFLGRRAVTRAADTAPSAPGSRHISSLSFVANEEGRPAAAASVSAVGAAAASHGGAFAAAARSLGGADGGGLGSASGRVPGVEGGAATGGDSGAIARGAASSAGERAAETSGEGVRGTMDQLKTARRENLLALNSPFGTSQSAGTMYDGGTHRPAAGGAPAAGGSAMNALRAGAVVANLNNDPDRRPGREISEPPSPIAKPPSVGEGKNVTPWQDKVDNAISDLDKAKKLQDKGNSEVAMAAASLAAMNLPGTAMHCAAAASAFITSTKTAADGMKQLNEIPGWSGNAGAGSALVRELTSIPGVKDRVPILNAGISNAQTDQHLAAANFGRSMPSAGAASAMSGGLGDGFSGSGSGAGAAGWGDTAGARYSGTSGFRTTDGTSGISSIGADSGSQIIQNQ
ncbi:MAG: hypothetical protein HY059_09680 [Proteobacteria bacterium]|nr:hypothetical protein [Pseudomonadota bacterium]